MTALLQILANERSDIEGDINAFSIRVILIASLLLIVLLAISSRAVKNKKHEGLKKPLFILIASTIALPTLLLIGSTIYINTVSESKGPVHWHTDIEYWVCNQEIELRNPSAFLSNKIGTSTYHEHDDKRIHLEGVVIEKDYDASLEKFMDVIDGYIDKERLVIPTEETIFENDTDGDKNTGDQQIVRGFLVRDSENKPTITVENGMTCGDGARAEVQTYLLRFNQENDTYTQTKLAEPERYIMRDESVVPPGDCVIVEFGPIADTTTRLCQQYGVRDKDRCTEFGVSSFNPDLCNIRQVVNNGGTQ